jgi:signal transduction histidine kinase
LEQVCGTDFWLPVRGNDRKIHLDLIPADRQQEEWLILAWLKNGEPVGAFRDPAHNQNRPADRCVPDHFRIKGYLGNITGLSQIARDITERKREDHRKNDFISIVSHELKTPLTTIKSYIQLALAKKIVRGDTPLKIF